jgi:DNA polymerase
MTGTAADLVTAYSALVSLRKSCRTCAGLVNPSACANGKYDSDHIGPWSLWQGNLDADLMIVGQDWGDTRYFLDNRGREARRNRTNDTLRTLLTSIGIEIAPPTPSDAGGGPCFFTNAILCLKQGGLQAKVDSAWFANCGSRFLKPTIEIVRPKVLVTLGEGAYRAVAGLYGLRRMPFRAAVEHEEGFAISGTTRYVPLYHCGARILNTHRPLEQQLLDWERVGKALKCPPGTP